MAARRKSNLATIAGLGLLATVMIARLDQQHPMVTRGAAVAVIVGVAAVYLLRRVRSSNQAITLAELERDITVTDDMSGTEFEHFVCRLMWVSGMTGVKVSGGAGDMGADIVGTTRDGRHIVVQCKRYKTNVGSPHVQRFAGTALAVHQADVAVLVTTTGFTPQARDIARMCRITLVDRTALARWARTREVPELTPHRRTR